MSDKINWNRGKRRPPRRLLECHECKLKTYDDGKRPLICVHCGATILEKI